MSKVCIFDLDGTLTDTLESLTYSVNGTLKELGLPEITSDQCRAFVGNGARYLIEESLKAAGDEELRFVDEAMEIYGRIFGENCTYHVTPYEGVADMLNALKEQGIRMAVLSNKPHEQTLGVVKHFFGEEMFDVIQGQSSLIERKPSPAGVNWILRELQAEKEECLYVGDSEVDIKTGAAASVKTVGVTWGFRTEELLKEAGAEYTIDKPEALLEFIRDKK